MSDRLPIRALGVSIQRALGSHYGFVGAALVLFGAAALLCWGPMLAGADPESSSLLRPWSWPEGSGEPHVQLIALLAFTLVFVVVVAFALPGTSMLMLAAGASLGLLWGIALCCIAALLGAGLPLLVLRRPVKRGLPLSSDGVDAGLRFAPAADRGRYLFALRLAPALRGAALERPQQLSSVGGARLLGLGGAALLVSAVVYVNAGAVLAGFGSLADLTSTSLLFTVLTLGTMALLPAGTRLAYRAATGRPAPASGSVRGALPGGRPGLRPALLLFSSVRDEEGFGYSRSRYRFDRAGFDLFSFPSNARVARFDIGRFVDRLARRAPRHGWRAVVSTHEQFGALSAALLSERLGLPGPAPEAILAAQHKLYARQVLDRVAPAANLGYRVLDCEYGGPVPEDIEYPAFVKPVKAAFSVLARRVDSREELAAMVRFGPFESWTIRHLVEPFERVVRARLPMAGSAHRMLVEECIDAPQFNLDGYVHRGEVYAIGVIDPEMYPGTQAFMRWDYPSRLSPQVQQRALDVARRFLRAIGFDDGMFNMEFFYDPRADRLAVIEFNPRMSSQPADLYRRVDGVDMHAMALALAEGIDPRGVPRIAAAGNVAASFVFRSFDPHARPALPSVAVRAELARRFPGALLITYPRSGRGILRDFKWLGSYRYALLHLEGDSDAHLRERCIDACALLGWAPPYADQVSQPGRAGRTLCEAGATRPMGARREPAVTNR